MKRMNKRTARWLGVAAGLLLIGGAAWWWTHRGLESEAVYYAFERAVERRDAAAIYAMILDVEKTRYGVTEEHVRKALDAIYYKHAPAVKRCGFLIPRGEEADRWHRYYPLWCDATTGKPLPSRHTSGTLFHGVDLFKTRAGGWKLCYTRWVGSYVMSNITAPALKELGEDEVEKRQKLRAEHAQLLKELGAAWEAPEIRAPPRTKVGGRFVLLAAPGEQPRPL